MHEHVRNEAPNFIPPIRIVDEQCCGRTICIFADLFVIVRIVTERKKQKQNETRMQFIDNVNKSELFELTFTSYDSPKVNDIDKEHDNLND